MTNIINHIQKRKRKTASVEVLSQLIQFSSANPINSLRINLKDTSVTMKSFQQGVIHIVHHQ